MSPIRPEHRHPVACRLWKNPKRIGRFHMPRIDLPHIGRFHTLQIYQHRRRPPPSTGLTNPHCRQTSLSPARNRQGNSRSIPRRRIGPRGTSRSCRRRIGLRHKYLRRMRRICQQCSDQWRKPPQRRCCTSRPGTRPIGQYCTGHRRMLRTSHSNRRHFHMRASDRLRNCPSGSHSTGLPSKYPWRRILRRQSGNHRFRTAGARHWGTAPGNLAGTGNPSGISGRSDSSTHHRGIRRLEGTRSLSGISGRQDTADHLGSAWTGPRNKCPWCIGLRNRCHTHPRCSCPRRPPRRRL